MAGNLYLLQNLLSESRRSGSTLHIASVDVSKAFDTVSHHALAQTIEDLGFPGHFVEYVRALYAQATTTFECGAGVSPAPVRIGRGVRQGVPWSALLFNLVIGRALSSINQEVGFRLGETLVGGLALQTI